MPTALRALLLLTLALLAGCGGMRLIDAQVQAHTTLVAGSAIDKGARYRFERLPSQTEEAVRTEQLESIAEAALTQVGLVRDEAQARYSVLLGTRLQSYLADAWGRPLGAPASGLYGSLMLGTGGSAFGMGMRFPPPTHYRFEVSLLLRDLPSGQVVFETRATHDGPWADAGNILPAMFEAALQDFPHPPSGPRQIKIEIPR